MNIVELDKFGDRHSYKDVIREFAGLMTDTVHAHNFYACGEVSLQLPNISEYLTPFSSEKYEKHEFCMWDAGFSARKYIKMQIFVDAFDGRLSHVECEVMDKLVSKSQPASKLSTKVKYELIGAPKIWVGEHGEILDEAYKRNGYSLEAALYMLVEVIFRVYLLDLLTVQAVAIKQINAGNLVDLPDKPLLPCNRELSPMVVIETAVTNIAKLAYEHHQATSNFPTIEGMSTQLSDIYHEFSIQDFVESLWSGQAEPTDVRYWWMSDNVSDKNIAFLGEHSQRYAEKLNGVSNILIHRHLRNLLTRSTNDSTVSETKLGALYNTLIGTIDTMFEGPVALCSNPSFFFVLPLRAILEEAIGESFYSPSGSSSIEVDFVYPLNRKSMDGTQWAGTHMLESVETHYLPYEGAHNEAIKLRRALAAVTDQFASSESIIMKRGNSSRHISGRWQMAGTDSHLLGRIGGGGNFEYFNKSAWLTSGAVQVDSAVCAPDVVVVGDDMQTLTIEMQNDLTHYESYQLRIARRFNQCGSDFPDGFDQKALTLTREVGGKTVVYSAEECVAHVINEMIIEFIRAAVPYELRRESWKEDMTLEDAIAIRSDPKMSMEGFQIKASDAPYIVSSIIYDIIVPVLLLLPNAKGVGHTNLSSIVNDNANIYPSTDGTEIDLDDHQYKLGGFRQDIDRHLHGGIDEPVIDEFGNMRKSERTKGRPIVPLAVTGIYTFGMGNY